MPDKEFDVYELYSRRRDKDWLVEQLRTRPEAFGVSLHTAINGSGPHGWRAAWILCHAMNTSDNRLQSRVGEIIDAIPEKSDGHQRELLRILHKLTIGEDHEGLLFDVCMALWADLQKASAVRVFAFKHIYNIADRYPELKNEVRLVTDDVYVETLSPGIRSSVRKLIKRLA